MKIVVEPNGMSLQTGSRNAVEPAKISHVSFSEVPIDSIYPSPENDELYRPADPSDPEIIRLAESIRENGVIEPLVLTLDNYILSGHRRYAAAKLAGLEMVPVRVEQIYRDDDIDRFVELLREYNRQREKSLDEKLREELVTVNPTEAYQSLIDQREEASKVSTACLKIHGTKRRSKISKAKKPFLDAIKEVLWERKKFWPLSVRSVHYAVLNIPPLIHASKPKLRYDNTQDSYKKLVELVTRARLDGSIPFEAISDDTRPVTTWSIFQTHQGFIGKQVDQFLKGYWRDLMQSQPNHIEIVGEKNTIDSILKPVAMEYCIPLTTGRGYCSIPPRHAMSQRFERSGKSKLVLLMVSDFDPDGEEIAHSFARSMRDDFGIGNIHPIKVALNADQVEEFQLPPNLTAKNKSANYKKFAAKYGDTVHEVEALDPEDLQNILRKAIDDVIDIDAFNHELNEEKKDSVFLQGLRNTVHESLKRIDLEY
jgi:hypothetical protein